MDELKGKVPDIIPDILAICTCNTCCAWHRVESKILKSDDDATTRPKEAVRICADTGTGTYTVNLPQAPPPAPSAWSLHDVGAPAPTVAFSLCDSQHHTAQTAMPAQARDHLQRMRSPHELSFTTRPQGGTRPKSEAPGGAQKHQDGPDHPGYPPAHTAPNPTKSTYRHAPLHAGQIVQLRHHHADTVGNGDGLKGRTRCSPAKFVLVPQPHRISPQPAITATRPRRP